MSACGTDFLGSDSRASPTYVSELRVNGATFLARHVNPTFASPGCSEDALYIGKLEGSRFFFSPPSDFSDSDQINDLISSENQGIDSSVPFFWKPFYFNFSSEIEAEFLTIAGTTPSGTDTFDPLSNDVPNTYSHRISIVQTANAPRPEFLLFGNYYLSSYQESIPVNATHIELWFSESKESEPALVHRVALENLYSWRNFVKPHIRTGDGISICSTEA